MTGITLSRSQDKNNPKARKNFAVTSNPTQMTFLKGKKTVDFKFETGKEENSNKSLIIVYRKSKN